jgi:hypothetical protein
MMDGVVCHHSFAFIVIVSAGVQVAIEPGKVAA